MGATQHHVNQEAASKSQAVHMGRLVADWLPTPEVTTGSGNLKPMERAVGVSGPAMAVVRSDHWQW